MAMTFTPTQLERFRREAKKLGRELSLSHSQALDRIAVRRGYQNWSLLAKHSEASGSGSALPAGPVRGIPTSVTEQRYYLHGDVDEDDSAHCYCARCDVFVEPGHFDGPGFHMDGRDCERSLASLARHNALTKSQKASRGRPDDASNVFAQRAVAERDAHEAARSPFHRWLEGQRDRDDIVGELAGDILRDESFPVGLATRHEVEARLSRHGGHIVRAVRAAWKEFSAGESSVAS